MALSDILQELEGQANRDGKAYRKLQRGLWLRVSLTGDKSVYSCGVAREWPFMPSVQEEEAVASALAPAAVSTWERRTNVPGPLEKRYNVSDTTYSRAAGAV